MSDDNNLTAALIKAQGLAWQGEWDEVRREISSLIDGSEEHHSAHLLLGMACENTGRLKDALVQFETILKLVPGQVLVLTKIARLKSRIGDVSGSVQAYWEVAQIYESSGNPAAAKAIWSEILGLEPSNIDARKRLAEANLSEGCKEKASAEYLELSKWSAKGDDYDQAVKFCESALEIDEANNLAKSLLRGIRIWIDMLQSGESTEALRQEFIKFLESPTDALSLDSIVAGEATTIPNLRRFAVGMGELLAGKNIENSGDRQDTADFQNSLETDHLLRTADRFEKQNQVEEEIVIYHQMFQNENEDIPTGSEKVLSEAIAKSREYLERGLFLAAVDECLFGISCQPGYLPLHIVLAEAYAAMGLAAEAVNKYKAIVDVYLVRGDVKGAIRMYQEILKLSPEDTVASSRLIYLMSEQEKALAE